MADYEPDDPQVRTITGDPEHPFGDFVTEIGEHVAAIHSAARARAANAGEDAANTIRVEIGVGPEKPVRPATDDPDCWDEVYPCGKSETGYIYCSVHICMTVGPVTVSE